MYSKYNMKYNASRHIHPFSPSFSLDLVSAPLSTGALAAIVVLVVLFVILASLLIIIVAIYVKRRREQHKNRYNIVMFIILDMYTSFGYKYMYTAT